MQLPLTSSRFGVPERREKKRRVPFICQACTDSHYHDAPVQVVSTHEYQQILRASLVADVLVVSIVIGLTCSGFHFVPTLFRVADYWYIWRPVQALASVFTTMFSFTYIGAAIAKYTFLYHGRCISRDLGDDVSGNCAKCDMLYSD